MHAQSTLAQALTAYRNLSADESSPIALTGLMALYTNLAGFSLTTSTETIVSPCASGDAPTQITKVTPVPRNTHRTAHIPIAQIAPEAQTAFEHALEKSPARDTVVRELRRAYWAERLRGVEEMEHTRCPCCGRKALEQATLIHDVMQGMLDDEKERAAKAAKRRRKASKGGRE